MSDFQWGHQHMIDRLKCRCEVSTQRAVAKDFGISPQYLTDILKGRRALPDEVALKMGYKAWKVYTAVLP